jgi:YidC/Oxa1 family membrane protein insertase
VTEDRRNFILFAVIAFVILIGWQLVVDRLIPPATPPKSVIVEGQSKPVSNPAADPTADSPAATRSRDQVLTASRAERIRIDTPALAGSINLRGAKIDDLVLKRHKESLKTDSPPIRLLSPAGAPEAYFAQLGWRGLPADTVWRANSNLLAPGRPVTLEAANATGQRFRIELAVDSDYLFTIKQTVANAGAAAVAVAPYGLVNRSGISKDPDYWTMHAGPMWVGNGAAHYAPDFSEVDEAPQSFRTTGGWLGFTDMYWLTALVPDQGQAFDGQFRAGPNKTYQADFALSERVLPPGKALTTTSRLFAGAKEVATLDRYTEAGVPKLDYAIDWGWFQVVEKPIFYYLDWLFRLVGNFGGAIILLTITIRLLMLPIAQKQFASMAAMKVVQPKMKVIQDRYKDDKEKMQREVMALYKAEGVNPLAGCLPVILQIPIFYALYKVLMLTIEMRHQPFIGWVKDLSAPDPLTPINLFGLLPFDPPSFLHLGVLAILLGVTMWLQFKLSPPAGDPATQQVMMFMPWLMMFIFAPLAAGLQLYYVMSNIISIGQQKLLYMRHPALKDAPAT